MRSAFQSYFLFVSFLMLWRLSLKSSSSALSRSGKLSAFAGLPEGSPAFIPFGGLRLLATLVSIFRSENILL